MNDELLTIGDLAARSGIAASAIRYYESRSLIASERTSGNQRRFHRSVLRRVSVIRAAQAVGLSLEEIGSALDRLPDRRTPTVRDWSRMSAAWRARLDAQITALQRLREDLDGCMGCGCLSLRACVLLNPDDRVSATGTGPRYLLGEDA